MTEPTPTNGPAAAPTVELAAMALDDEKKNGSNGAAGAASPSPSSAPGLKDQFTAFSKFGDCKSDGKQITLSQSDKWMKQAKVIDKQITTTDTGIHFKKFKTLKIGLGDYKKFIEDLAKTKNVPMGEIVNKLSTCGAPGINQVNVSCSLTSAALSAELIRRVSFLGGESDSCCVSTNGPLQIHRLAQGAV